MREDMPNNLAALRAKYQFSQLELADRVGVTPLTLGRWERGEMLPSKRNRQALCEALECTEEDLGFSTQTLAIVAPSSDVAPIYDAIIPLTHTEFVGRETELAHIKAQLLGHGDGSVVVSALNGIPGVGKTSLAIVIAHDAEIRVSFCHGILWAALGPNPNIPGLLSRWARLLGLSEARFRKLDEGQKRQELRKAFGERSMLLVLDDVWRLDDALALDVGGRNCATLLTTRFPVIASRMAVKDALLIEELDAEQSFHLLSTLAPKAVEYAPEKVRALVQTVGGLPLALTLLGKHLCQQSYNVPARRTAFALEQLNDAQTRLQISELHVQAEAHPSIASSTPITLQSIIEVSDRHLTPLAREALYALAVLPPKPGSFSEDAALTIADCTTRELDELVDVGLLESIGNRYRLHRTIADYARLQRDEQTEEQLTRRLIAYVQQYVESHAKEYELLEQEMTLLLHALDRAVTGEAFQSQIVPLVCASAPFLLMRGYYRETERFLERAYEEARAYQEARAAMVADARKGREGTSPTSTHLKFASMAHASQDAKDIARVLLYLGELDEQRGNLSRAKERYNLAMQEVEQHDSLQGVLLCHIGRLTWKLGDYQEAEALLQQGLALARQIGHREWTCAALLTLTTVLCEKGACEEAKTYLQEAFTLAKELDILRFICFALEAEGNLSLALLQGDAALLAFQKMRRLGPQGDFEVEALSFYGMACSYEQMGQRDEALSCGQQALALVQQKSMGWYEQRIQAWYTRFLNPSTPTESVTCICGKTFVRPSGPGRTRQYCSDRCANRARKRTQRKQQEKRG
jgi:transcriptional regulator with XRE-family HTH domain/tetratricopeptide (TPR) repeat protein